MSILTGPLVKYVAGGVVLLMIIGMIYTKGRWDERSAWETRLASDHVTIIRDGQEIDHEVLSADDDRLCALLGGCELPDGANGN